MDRVRSFLNLQRGEERSVFLLFSYLTLIMTAYIITKAVRDGLFLQKFSAYMLPWVYLGIAAIIGFVVSIYVKLSARIGQTAVIVGSLLFFIGNLLLLWWGVRKQWTPTTWIFYVWTSMFGIIVVTQVWTVANQVLDLRQAKRLFPLISSGAILGSALGGFTAARLAKVKSVGTDNLMLVLIPLLLLAGIVAQMLLARHSHSRAPQGKRQKQIDFKTALKTIKDSPYLKLIVVLLALSNIVTLVVGIQFADVVKHAFSAKNQITSFMGSFTAYFSLFSFLLQVLAGSRLVEKFGVRWIILVLPLALTGGTLVLLAFPLALWAGMVLKGSDHTLRYSIDRATTELLYLPLPQSTKAEVKAVTDMVGQRLADGVGALIVLFVTLVLKGGQVSLCILDLILLATWLGIAFRTRREYVRVLWGVLLEGRDLGKEVIGSIVDRNSLPSIKTLLAAKDEDVVLRGMELAVGAGHREWIPRELISDSSTRVRLKAMEIVPLSERELLERVQNDSNPLVRASAIVRAAQQTSVVGRREAALTQYLQSTDLRVRLSALTALARQREPVTPGTLKKALDQIVAELQPDSGGWKDVAEALGEVSHPEAAELHLRLLQHPNPKVKKQAILSAGQAGRRELVPFLIPLLSDAEWAPDARLTLREYGYRILGSLADRLRDPTEDIEIRRNIPLVLAYIPDQPAVDILLDAMGDYDGVVRYRSIRALGKLRLVDPSLHFDPERVVTCVRDDGKKTLGFRQAQASLYPQDGSKDLLLQLLKDKFERGKDRVFRLLALLLPPRAAMGSILVIRAGDRLATAKVIELLDNLLPGKLKDVVLPLIEPSARWLKSDRTRQQILAAFLSDPDPILRECAADALRKKRWPEVTGLEPLLARVEEGIRHGR
ncbi:MAG: HEAT repeat domain-containing protein [Acidobacteriia bacterium]|nr:HEAT repeat domain-containing protein [Terriglobia bacterium]